MGNGAGQLLQTLRSKVTIERGTDGAITAIAIDVPGRPGKPAGKYFLTTAAIAALRWALEAGHLRELSSVSSPPPGVDFS